ncbi:MAG: radical SAM protein [Candidatus Sulfomarinibacteraceae bacterium]
MRVLLVNPDYEIERYMGRHFGRMGWVMPPMGLLYLAAQLEAEGVEVAVYDAQVDERSLDEALGGFEPAIVGITCATALVGSTLEAARIAKERLPGVTVVVGGVHPTVRPDDLLGGPHVDIAVRGEGLHTIVEIARAVASGARQELEDIRGISFRRGGEPVHNPSRPLEPDVDTFPFPARHLVPMEIYRMSPDLSIRPPMDIVFGAYGCPYDCVFCAAQSVMGGSFRARSLDNIFSEIDRVVREQNPRTLLMGDDNFVLSKERTLDFCDRYRARGYHETLPWQVATRVDSVDGEILRAMAQAGCYLVSFGIESGVGRLLDTVEKGAEVGQAETAVRLAKEAGLVVRATFILGLPGETVADSEATIRFSRKLPLDQVRFALATPFPGTKLWEIAMAEGSVETDDWMRLSSMGGYRSDELFYVPKGRDSEELKRLQRRANFGFYFRPRIVAGFVRRIRSLDELGEYARGAWGLLKATVAPY